MILDLLDGVERQSKAAPAKSALAGLRKFRRQLDTVRNPSERARYEAELEKFLESKPQLKAAAWRHLTNEAVAALHAARVAVKDASDVVTDLTSANS